MLGIIYQNELNSYTIAEMYIDELEDVNTVEYTQNCKTKQIVLKEGRLYEVSPTLSNIKTDSFIDVWENKYKEFRKKRLTTNEKCRKCKSFKYCRGGSFHTWNFDDNVQNMCMKDLLGKEFVE